MALSYKNDSDQDERLDPFAESARELYRQERSVAEPGDGGGRARGAAGADELSGNIARVREDEAARPATTFTYTPRGPGRGGAGKSRVRFWHRKGPAGALIAVVLGGGIGLGGLFSPALALVHIKEVIADKFDSLGPVVETRSNLALKNRMFGTSASCAIKVRCRFSGLTERQMARLESQGAKLLDADGKPVTKNKVTRRYTGGKTLILADKTPVDANTYAKLARSNALLRDTGRAVFSPRWAAWNGKASRAIRARERLTTNPRWGDDEKKGRKTVFGAVSGESGSAVSQDASDSEKYQTDENGNVKKDQDGKPIPKDPTQASVDFGEATENINNEAAKLREAAQAGEPIPQIPSDPGGAAAMAETSLSSPGAVKKALGFLNPADFLVGLCTTYKLTNALVMTAKTIALANAMRYASLFLSTADKIKAGEATPEDVSQAMTILQREDDYGDAFGDSVGYQYAEYGTVPDKDVASSATGNAVIHVLAAVISWINDTLGKRTVKTGCGILSNPVTQGALALTSFIPGGGTLLSGVKTVVSTGAKKFAEQTIRESVKKIVQASVKKTTDKLSKDALKAASRSAGKVFLKMAGGAAGIFLASYLTERYAIPYLARVLAGAELTGSENGVTAMDTIANGFDAVTAATAQEEGLAPLTTEQYTAYRAYRDASTATYVADMRAHADPLDATDPYSASSSVAAGLVTFGTALRNHGPLAILSALAPSRVLATAEAAPDDARLCDDDYLNAKNLATSPFCNVRYGFPDAAMLQTTDPTAVIDWMLAHQQIDDDGNAVAGSDFEKFQQECGPGSGGKIITELDDDASAADSDVLPEECYGPKNSTTAWKYYRLYTIDQNTVGDMDADTTQDGDQTTHPKYIAKGDIPIEGIDVGASVFGGKQEGGHWVENLADNGGNDIGDHGNHLTGTSSFAELDMGKALGNIPDGTKLEIRYEGKTIIAEKGDIGAGGGDVNGHKRAIDLWWQAANALDFNTGLDVVTIHVVGPATPLTPV